nr:MAG: PemK-like, MazF-like toxin of type II toxin-antitoxin system [Bacteriophage sp.]
MSGIHRGEIYYISRGGASPQGCEQYPDRPAVIVSNEQNNEHSGTVEVVYMTTQPKTDLPTHCVIRSTGRTSTVLCEQVNSVSVERIGTYIGEVSEQEIQNIDIALMISLQLDGNAKTSKKYQEQIKRQQEEIDGLRQQLSVAKEEAAKWQQEQEAAAETSGDSVIRVETEKDTYKAMFQLEAERDVYKAMYEKLLEKVIA